MAPGPLSSPACMVEPVLARRLRTAARKGREWTQERDRLIVEALEAGGSQREVADLVGLTQPAVGNIYRRHRATDA